MRPERAGRSGSIVAALATLLACSSQSAKQAESEPPPVARAEPERAPATSPIPNDSRQLLIGVSDDWDDATIEIFSYERSGGAWTQNARWPATIGHAGLGWGRGLHGEAAPEGRNGPDKVEGDGKSPAGVFSIGRAYGYAKKPPQAATLSYTQVDRNWRCVDDPASKHYNKIIDESGKKVDWKSAEHMKRSDELYRWVIEIDHNLAATPKAGSCIFFHVWGAPGDTTVGCAAMDKSKIESLVAWLDPDKKPVVVLLPEPELDALRESWSLPN